MDFEREFERKPNPKIKANFFSLITFFFTYTLLRRGQKVELEEHDIYEVMPKFKSSKLGDKIEKEWMKHSNPTNTTILKVLWACFGKYYLFLGVIQFFMKTVFIFIQPRALGKLISYFTADSKLTKSDAYYYATVLIVLNIVNCTYVHNYMLLIAELGIQVRTAFCSLIYRKALKLNHTSLSDITIGKIVTLISKDVYNFDTILIFLNDIWISVFILIITTVLIYVKLGVATFAGVGFLLAIIPLQVYIGKLTSSFRLTASKTTDQRIQFTQETLSAIKIIKMYTWENFYGKKISDCRKEEIDKIKKIYYTKATSLVIGGLIINITMYIIVSTYTSLGNYFTAEVAFYLLACLQNLRSVVMVAIPLGIAQTAELTASLSRINKLLLAKEITSNKSASIILNPYIFLEKVSVQMKSKYILENVNLRISSGLNVITGRVGGGKSSLVKTILQDYTPTLGKLKVQGSVSYASEEPWLFPSSLRQNILFGEKYEKERYMKVLEVCALKQDVDTFELGDETILDDRGMNLSKGQQARVSLARAVYKNSDIYLLDDCLSSLDAHVQEFVFQECIKKFLQGKIVIMISHNEKNIRGADQVIIMENGTVKSCEKPTEITSEEIQKINQVESEEQETDIIDNLVIENNSSEESKLIPEKTRKNIYEEKKKKGKVDRSVYKKYCQFGGPLLLFVGIVVMFLGSQIAVSFAEKLVTSWVNVQQKISTLKLNNTKQFELLEKNLGIFSNTTNGTQFPELLEKNLGIFFKTANETQFKELLEKNLGIFSNTTNETQFEELLEKNLTIFFKTVNGPQFKELLEKNSRIFFTYSMAIIFATVLLLTRAIAHFNFSSRASVNLHKNMAKSITNATMQFFDVHYIGNILNRFSKDLGTIDEYLPFVIYECLRLVCTLGGIIILIATVNVTFLIPAALFLIKLFFIRKLYLPTARSLKRLDSATRSPVLGHLNATLEGLTTIRAYGTQPILREEFDRHQDLYTSTAHMVQCTQRTFAYFLDMMCQMFILTIILKFLIFNLDVQAGGVGLAITQAFMLTGLLQWAVRQWTELETQMTSVERVLEYGDVKTENKSGIMEKNWPTNGKISYEGVNLTYGHSKELVLKDINFTVNPSEKIGIVGRTGAGKSSIISTLFRLYNFEGSIRIDDLDINTLSLTCLRSNIAIIPQDPILFSGTLRINIDPTNQYKDEEIWRALKTVKMQELITSLEDKITENGSNFSSGQKQLLCLARAIVSNNKIIVLDEATANMDPETDALIHETIQQNFGKCTVLTIAHRLHSVLKSDKVMVVDKGVIVEYDNPDVLLSNQDGIFYKMVKRANLL